MNLSVLRGKHRFPFVCGAVNPTFHLHLWRLFPISWPFLIACYKLALWLHFRAKPSPSRFTPVRFVIKDKRGSRRTVFNCEMIAGQGIVVRTLRGYPVMEIRLPDSSQNSMGKILHPVGSTLYKVLFWRFSKQKYLWNKLDFSDAYKVCNVPGEEHNHQ